MRVQILEPAAAQATLRRMAFEVYEQNFDSAQLTLLGLGTRGHHIAAHLLKVLQEISPLKLDLLQVEKGPDQQLDSPPTGQNWLIVDDVLYTGRTQYDTLYMLHTHAPGRVQVAVLIDR
ncbi:MAG: phosphoribosyltransferase family protein, partial [Bacteroidota bacterium]